MGTAGHGGTMCRWPGSSEVGHGTWRMSWGCSVDQVFESENEGWNAFAERCTDNLVEWLILYMPLSKLGDPARG